MSTSDLTAAFSDTDLSGFDRTRTYAMTSTDPNEEVEIQVGHLSGSSDGPVIATLRGLKDHVTIADGSKFVRWRKKAGTDASPVVWVDAVAAAVKGDAGAGTVFALDMTLIAGAKTLASGKVLSGATIVGYKLKALNATPALAAQLTLAISTNSVVATAYAADGTAATTDVATYTVYIVGAV